MLVPMRAILDAADKNDYAQGAFNVNAVCQEKAVINVHEMFRSPAILQGADLANGFMGGRTDFANATLEDKKPERRTLPMPLKNTEQTAEFPLPCTWIMAEILIPVWQPLREAIPVS